MGRLIPAGTGLPAYKRLNLVVEGEEAGAPFERPRREEPLAVVNEE
jgi:DNA-directed RNA polymerase subunit beta'